MDSSVTVGPVLTVNERRCRSLGRERGHTRRTGDPDLGDPDLSTSNLSTSNLSTSSRRHTGAVGFDPNRPYNAKPLDYVLVGVCLAIAAGLLTWAFLG